MPWRESCAMDERMRFIVDCRSDEWTMTELCERYEISRKTGYKWLERYEISGTGAKCPWAEADSRRHVCSDPTIRRSGPPSRHSRPQD
jgi:Homeodomain-like domain